MCNFGTFVLLTILTSIQVVYNIVLEEPILGEKSMSPSLSNSQLPGFFVLDSDISGFSDFLLQYSEFGC